MCAVSLLHFLTDGLLYNIIFMEVIINGQSISLPENATLQCAIDRLAKQPAHVIAEVDGVIVARGAWPVTRLTAQSRVELITFVGGG